MRSNIVKNLCKKHCKYYKPSKDNELACKGFTVIEKLIKNGRKISFNKSEKKVSASTGKKLIGNMCVACSFYEDGCDFAAEKKGAPPCGGFILLGHLLDGKIITIDDIVNIH
ncbi:MAG: hypothetical protein FD156_1987 [Nitrospirae bacterium]|nr:MAG: hypothetical protein FD156_1987 [Nitrospirota bacterium]